MAFGLFPQKENTADRIRRDADLLFERINIVDPKKQTAFRFGETISRQRGARADFRQFRPYRDGDTPSAIDWKRSARSDEVLVKEKEESCRRLWDIHIMDDSGLDFRSNKKNYSKREMAALLATLISLHARKTQDAVRIDAQTKGDVTDIALNTRTVTDGPFSAQSITILLGDFLAPVSEIEQQWNKIPSSDVICIQIFDPAERNLPYTGRAMFHDTHDRHQVDDVDAIREEYTAALNDHIFLLRNDAVNRGWDFYTIDTTQDIAPVMVRALSSKGAV